MIVIYRILGTAMVVLAIVSIIIVSLQLAHFFYRQPFWKALRSICVALLYMILFSFFVSFCITEGTKLWPR